MLVAFKLTTSIISASNVPVVILEAFKLVTVILFASNVPVVIWEAFKFFITTSVPLRVPIKPFKPASKKLSFPEPELSSEFQLPNLATPVSWSIVNVRVLLL